jgi:NAD-dependent SIR2 family protein deacetylase
MQKGDWTMTSTASLTCTICAKTISKKDLIAITKKNSVVHLICGAIQLKEGVIFIGRTEKMEATPVICSYI